MCEGKLARLAQQGAKDSHESSGEGTSVWGQRGRQVSDLMSSESSVNGCHKIVETSETGETLYFQAWVVRLTCPRSTLRINAEVHAGWCSPRTSNPVVPILSGRSVRFRLTSASASQDPVHLRAQRRPSTFCVTARRQCKAGSNALAGRNPLTVLPIVSFCCDTNSTRLNAALTNRAAGCTIPI